MKLRLMRACALAVTAACAVAGLPGGAVAQSPAVVLGPPPAESMSPSGGPEVLGELVEMRTATSRTWAMDDGSRRLEVFAAPIHRLDPSGFWTPILNGMRQTGDGFVAGEGGPVATSLPEAYDDAGGIGVAGAEGASVAVVPLADPSAPMRGGHAEPVGGETTRRSAGRENTAGSGETAPTVRYVEVTDGVDVELSATVAGVKEAIVLHRLEGSDRSWQFRLDGPGGLAGHLRADGAVDLVDGEGQADWFLPAPYMIDSAAQPARSDGVAFTVDADDPAVVTVTVTDEAWLADPARVWPVRVDPTVYATGVTTDCQLQAAFPDLVDCSSDTGLVDDTHRLIVDFDLPGLLDEPVTIRHAGFELYRNQADPGSSTATLTAHRIDQDWDAGSVTWNDAQTATPWGTAGAVAAGSQEYATTVGSDVTWINAGRLAQEWVNDDTRTSGLVLATEPGSGYYRFDLSETAHLDRWPRLYVDYEPLIGVEDFYSYTHIDLDDGRTIDVNHASGNLTLTTTDVDLSAATGLAGTGVTRTYNSRYLYGTAYHWQAADALGWQWQLTPHTGNQLHDMVSSGRTLLRDHRRVFSYDDGTAWHSPPFVAETLVRNGDQTWTATDPQAGTTWTYSPAGYPTALDHAGQTGGLQFGYDTAGRMDLIADAQAQPLVTYTYRTDGAHTPVPIASLTDPSGGVHTYDVQGYELRSYTPPAGPVTTYDWDQVAITDITRGDEHVEILNDADGRALQVTRTATGEPTQTWTFDYTTPWQTTITHPDGTPETVHFGRDGRITGGAQPTLPAPVINSPTHPDATPTPQATIHATWAAAPTTPPGVELTWWEVAVTDGPETQTGASTPLTEHTSMVQGPGEWWLHVRGRTADGQMTEFAHHRFVVADSYYLAPHPAATVWGSVDVAVRMPGAIEAQLEVRAAAGTWYVHDVQPVEDDFAALRWDTFDHISESGLLEDGAYEIRVSTTDSSTVLPVVPVVLSNATFGGPPAWLPPGEQALLHPPTVISGNDWASLAAQTAAAGFPASTPSHIVLAPSNFWPSDPSEEEDLSGMYAGPWAAKLGAPMLLATPSGLPAATEELLATWFPSPPPAGQTHATVHLVGKMVDSAPGLVQELEAHGLAVVAVAAGQDTADAAVTVAGQVAGPDDTIVIASGASWPSALVGSGLAATLSGTLLLTEPSGGSSPPDALPSGADPLLSNAAAVYLVGTDTEISIDLEQQVAGLNAGATRITTAPGTSVDPLDFVHAEALSVAAADFMVNTLDVEIDTVRYFDATTVADAYASGPAIGRALPGYAAASQRTIAAGTPVTGMLLSAGPEGGHAAVQWLHDHNIAAVDDGGDPVDLVQVECTGCFQSSVPVHNQNLTFVGEVAPRATPPTAVGGASCGSTVHVPVGADYVDLIENEEAECYQFDAGIYEGFSVLPDSGDRFYGDPNGGTILDGSVDLGTTICPDQVSRACWRDRAGYWQYDFRSDEEVLYIPLDGTTTMCADNGYSIGRTCMVQDLFAYSDGEPSFLPHAGPAFNVGAFDDSGARRIAEWQQVHSSEANATVPGPGEWHLFIESELTGNDAYSDRSDVVKPVVVRLGSNPASFEQLRLTTAARAFGDPEYADGIEGAARDGVAIANVEVRHYGSWAQTGAIDGLRGSDWTLWNLNVHHNHGAGVRLGRGGALHDSRIADNGQLGVKAQPYDKPTCTVSHTGQGPYDRIDTTAGVNDCTIRGAGGPINYGLRQETRVELVNNVITGNNRLGFNPNYEAGAMKIQQFWRGVEVRNNNVVDNYGHGIWFDIDNANVSIRENYSARNFLVRHQIDQLAVPTEHLTPATVGGQQTAALPAGYDGGSGIFYEISYGPAFIQDNVVEDNHFHGLWISTSRDTLLQDNSITGDHQRPLLFTDDLGRQERADAFAAARGLNNSLQRSQPVHDQSRCIGTETGCVTGRPLRVEVPDGTMVGYDFIDAREREPGPAAPLRSRGTQWMFTSHDGYLFDFDPTEAQAGSGPLQFAGIGSGWVTDHRLDVPYLDINHTGPPADPPQWVSQCVQVADGTMPVVFAEEGITYRHCTDQPSPGHLPRFYYCNMTTRPSEHATCGVIV